MIRTWPESSSGWLVQVWPGPGADVFLRPPTLKASNFAPLLSTDHIFLALKDLNLLKRYTENQEASCVFRINFATSKWPHIHRAYLLTEFKHMSVAVLLLIDMIGPYWGLLINRKCLKPQILRSRTYLLVNTWLNYLYVR